MLLNQIVKNEKNQLVKNEKLVTHKITITLSNSYDTLFAELTNDNSLQKIYDEIINSEIEKEPKENLLLEILGKRYSYEDKDIKLDLI